MPVDMRTRRDDQRGEVDPTSFFEHDLPEALEAHSAFVLPGLRFLSPRPLAIEVDGPAWTLEFVDDHVAITPSVRDGVAHVRLQRDQFADIVQDQATFMSFWAANSLDQPSGSVGHLLDWWLVLRAALDGRPIYVPGSLTFRDRNGAPLDLARSFSLDDDPAEMQNFLEEAGFLHIRNVFTEDEMARMSADMDAAAPSYNADDGRSWWARTDRGETRLVRMRGFEQHSPAARELLADPRFLDLAGVPGSGHVFGARRTDNLVEALIKPIGVTEGISDIPWHKDCGIGRHSYECCSMTVGISVTAADETSGQLRVLAGSHRALVWSSLPQPRLDLPDRPLATRTGDITVHLSCTMHMAQPPTDRERRVLYSGFSLPPFPDIDRDAISAGRARLGSVRDAAPLTVLDRHFKS
jgi:Phytanoyl-CoA dioxygenase (PhyH)